jgi:hypothetical protein
MSKKKFQRELNKLDQQSKDIMINLERKCRHIKSGCIPFSPESILWIQHAQAYRSLLHYHHGLIRNIGNLKRMARRCGILRCLSISEDEACLCLRVCEERCDYFRKHRHKHQEEHLQKCLQSA